MEKNNFSTLQSDSYCTTASAAKIMGLSVGTIQNMVETKKLLAWKTSGGHRRISMNSIMAYKRTSDPLHFPTDIVFNNLPQVVIVEDDQNTITMLEAYFERWELPLNLMIYSSASKALLDWHSLYPAVVLTDLLMPQMNGFEFIKTIQSKKINNSMIIVAISGLEDQEIHNLGGLPEDILVIKKPFDMDWFKGFLQGVILLQK